MASTMRLHLGLPLLLAACTAEVPTEAPPATPPATPTRVAAPPRLVPAPAGGSVAEVVSAERGAAGDALLIVYVGASWCEPCVAFHDALTAGELDASLAGVRFLEFDLDRDKARLEADGYRSRYVPLFALPGPDGRASGRHIEGGTKGAGAAASIVRRLTSLLAGERQMAAQP